MTCWVHWVFWQCAGKGATLPHWLFLFSPFLLTDNAAFLSLKSCPHAFRRHLAPYLFFTAVSSLSHNLFETLPESYSQRARLNRRFLFIDVGLLPGDVSEGHALLRNVCVFLFYWLHQIHTAVKKGDGCIVIIFYYPPEASFYISVCEKGHNNCQVKEQISCRQNLVPRRWISSLFFTAVCWACLDCDSPVVLCPGVSDGLWAQCWQ